MPVSENSAFFFSILTNKTKKTNKKKKIESLRTQNNVWQAFIFFRPENIFNASLYITENLGFSNV
jgi:hypothetical protein